MKRVGHSTLMVLVWQAYGEGSKLLVSSIVARGSLSNELIVERSD